MITIIMVLAHFVGLQSMAASYRYWNSLSTRPIYPYTMNMYWNNPRPNFQHRSNYYLTTKVDKQFGNGMDPFFVAGKPSSSRKSRRSAQKSTKFSYQAVPYIVYGIFPNHTTVLKFPNGTHVSNTMNLTSADSTTITVTNTETSLLNEIQDIITTVEPTTAITFIQRIHSTKSRKSTSTDKSIDPQAVINALIEHNKKNNVLVKKPVPEVSNSLAENLKTLRELEKEQSDILKQLAFLNRLRVKQGSMSNSNQDQFKMIDKLIQNINQNKTWSNDLESILGNLTDMKMVKTVYGNTKEALLAAALKEHGIGPAAFNPDVFKKDDQIRNSMKKGFNWIMNNLETTTKKRKRKKKKRPNNEQLDLESSSENIRTSTLTELNNLETITEFIDLVSSEKPKAKRKRKRKPVDAAFEPVGFNHVDGVPDDQNGFKIVNPILERAMKSFQTIFQFGAKALGGILQASSAGFAGLSQQG